MRGYKKVSGERVVAALVDYIIMQVVGVIVTIVPMLVMGFDNFFDMLFGVGMEPVGDDILSEGFIIFTMVTVYLGFVVSTLYFCVVPWLWKGQTIGKKLMKLKAVNEYGENPNFFQHLVRGVQNWSTVYIALIGWVIVINYLLYSILSMGTLVVSILFLISFIMMLAREDGRGMHDMISGTYVIKVDENLDKEFAEQTAQMGDWVEVEDSDDDWDKKEPEEEKDEWEF